MPIEAPLVRPTFFITVPMRCCHRRARGKNERPRKECSRGSALCVPGSTAWSKEYARTLMSVKAKSITFSRVRDCVAARVVRRTRTFDLPDLKWRLLFWRGIDRKQVSALQCSYQHRFNQRRILVFAKPAQDTFASRFSGAVSNCPQASVISTPHSRAINSVHKS